jgi:ATP-binding cassette subfamily B protein
MSLFKPGAKLLDAAAVRLFARYYRKRAGRLAAYALGTSLQSLLVLPTLFLVRYAFDQGIPNGQVELLLILGLGIVSVRIAHSLVGLALRAFVLDIIKEAVSQLRRDILDRLFLLSREHLAQADRDQMHTRIVLDSERFDNLSNRLLSGMLPALFSGGALFLVLVALNWQLVALAAAVLPVVALSSRLGGQRVKRDVKDFQDAMEHFSKGAQFTLRHMDLIRLKAAEERERHQQHRHVERMSADGRRMAMSYAFHGYLQRNITGLAGIIILVAGGAGIASGSMTLGDLMAFYIAAGLLNGQVENVVGGVPELVAGNEALLHLHGLLHDGALAPYPTGTRRVAFDGSLSFRDVAFAYGEHAILRGVTLDLKPDSNIAIVGPNGAGKSTLLNLLAGFSQPAKGEIRANGVPYAELDIADLRAQIGVVMQHPGFFGGNVLENLRYGQPETPLEAVRAAARLALADDFIMGLPEGYGTDIGEGGALLSGGERQKLAIARALLNQPRLLVLDEPTNHLDAESMAQLMVRLTSAPQRPALLTISHDPGVIAYAETVYRLEQGRLLAEPPAIARRSAP